MSSAISSRGFEAPRVFQVPPDPQCDGQESDDPNHEVKPVEPCLERLILVPLLAEDLADISEPQAPGERTDECVNDESTQIHSRHTRRKCNERANHRQQAACENDQLAALDRKSVV